MVGILGLLAINFALCIDHKMGADSFVAWSQFVCLFRFLRLFAFASFFPQVSWPCVVAVSFSLFVYFFFTYFNSANLLAGVQIYVEDWGDDSAKLTIFPDWGG